MSIVEEQNHPYDILHQQDLDTGEIQNHVVPWSWLQSNMEDCDSKLMLHTIDYVAANLVGGPILIGLIFFKTCISSQWIQYQLPTLMWIKVILNITS